MDVSSEHLKSKYADSLLNKKKFPQTIILFFRVIQHYKTMFILNDNVRLEVVQQED